MAIVQLRRDPFARETLVRMTAFDSENGCRWCSNWRYRNGQLTYGLFCYGVEQDQWNGRIDWDRELFCSLSCRRSYHE